MTARRCYLNLLKSIASNVTLHKFLGETFWITAHFNVLKRLMMRLLAKAYLLHLLALHYVKGYYASGIVAFLALTLVQIFPFRYLDIWQDHPGWTLFWSGWDICFVFLLLLSVWRVASAIDRHNESQSS